MKTKRVLWRAYIQYLLNFIVIAAVTLLQAAFFWLVIAVSQYFLIFYFFIMLLSTLLTLSIYQSSGNSSFKLSWTIFILLVPFIGAITYLMFGNGRTLPKRKIRKINSYLSDKMPQNDNTELIRQLDPVGYKHISLLNSIANFPCHYNTESTFYSDGLTKFEALLADINNAKKFIFLEYFIIARGYAYDTITEALIRKAKEGVEVKIIYDDVGSKFVISKRDVVKLNRNKNIKMMAYNPMSYMVNLGMNYRDHRKIAVIDGNIAYVGGDNIADEYIHKIDRFGFWRDNAIRLEGEAVYNFIVMFAQNWYICSREMLDTNLYRGDLVLHTHRGVHVPFSDGPSNTRNPAYNLYTSLIENAQNYLYISTPYFIIDKEFITRLVNAKRSGVDVKILLPGIPDKKTVYKMTKSHYRDLLRAGVEIYEFTPGFNHAKNFIVDDRYAVVGTVNIDYRSLFLHFECADFMLYDPNIPKIKEDFIDAVSKSHLVTYEEWHKRSFFTKCLEAIFAALAPLL